jgi:hypothetical protein
MLLAALLLLLLLLLLLANLYPLASNILVSTSFPCTRPSSSMSE